MAGKWHDLGPIDELKRQPLRQIRLGRTTLAVSYVDGQFGAVSGVCNHVGGPLGDGQLDGEYIVCPWHHWKYHCRTGLGEPGFENDRVPRHELREESGHLFVNLEPATKRNKAPHKKHPLERKLGREAGPLRIVGISTTAMDAAYPRYSTSDALLEVGLAQAAEALGTETRLIKLNDLKFRACEGYYSKSAQACTWPCSITQADRDDEMDQVYDAFVFWADVILISTPIRWGNASALYYKMAERMNCIQNQITIRDHVLLRNKMAAFIITNDQDNVQTVTRQLLMFFAELGCHFPQFPFVGHSRGWSAEDMENNVAFVKTSDELREGVKALVGRAVDLAQLLTQAGAGSEKVERAGRKACPPSKAAVAASG